MPFPETTAVQLSDGGPVGQNPDGLTQLVALDTDTFAAEVVVHDTDTEPELGGPGSAHDWL